MAIPGKIFPGKPCRLLTGAPAATNPAAFSGTAGAVQDKSFLSADIRLPGGLAKPLGQVALPSPIGLKGSHFFPFGKDGPVSRRVGGGPYQEEQRNRDVR
jgi:hypothetical protein